MRDENNNLVGLTYNNETYYYKKNIQEDIIGIYNSMYEQIVEYEYDAWGKVLSVKDAKGQEITAKNHIAHINPFRYRSYYYDEETKLYYLNSRYYNPEWGRFINVDGAIGVSNDYLGYNLYVYGNNNPISNYDNTGRLFKKILSAVIKVVTTPIKLISSAVALLGGTILSKPISGEMYSHSFRVNESKELPFSTKEKIISSVKSSVEVKETIKTAINNSDGKYFSGSTSDLKFKDDKDLYLSIHAANLTYEGIKTNDKWIVNMTLSDKYDFTDWLSPFKSFGNFMNDVGFIQQSIHHLEPYYWEVNFRMIYEE